MSPPKSIPPGIFGWVDNPPEEILVLMSEYLCVNPSP